MNAPHLFREQLRADVPGASSDAEIDLRQYWDLILDSRWIIVATTLLAVVSGSFYAFLSRPVYEPNVLIQVEDSTGSPMAFLGDAASMFDIKSPATAEIELIRSRMVIGQAVDKTNFHIEASPNYLPFIGPWLARHSESLSEPGFLGVGGYVTGAERINVDRFNVPPSLEGTKFSLEYVGDGKFALNHPKLVHALTGTIGIENAYNTPDGKISLLISEIRAKPGAEFTLIRQSRIGTIELLQDRISLVEKGRQSGIIDGRLQGTDAQRLVNVLNEIARQYVHQNIERKAAEAQKTLAFLDVQLPQLKKQLEQAEDAYSRYRNRQGSVALDEEAKLVLGRSIDLKSKLLEAQQKRRELITRFTPKHPQVMMLDGQIEAWNAEITALDAKIHAMPTVQQDALRFERDVKVNQELYQQLRNNALQLQLVKEGKIGNVRLIDEAVVPDEPIRPNKPLAIALSMILGVIVGIVFALVRNAFFRGVRSSEEIETTSGLQVFSTIPLSPTQEALAMKVNAREPGVHVLASLEPNDSAVESLRSLRTALQFAMLEADNNRVLITGATPGVGKSFVASNLAAVVASAGKKVLLVDADLRKGYLNSYFGESRARGLSEVISGSLKLADAIRPALTANLDLLPTGVLPPNPAELLTNGALPELLAQMSKSYDIVIFDTAPILAAADTLSLAPHMGTVMLVARAEQSQVGELRECAKRVAHTGKRINGVVFNALDTTKRHQGNYGYRYGGYRYQPYSY